MLLTGIPRSGSTLLLKLITDYKHVVGLDEPNWLKEIRQLSEIDQIPIEMNRNIEFLREQVYMGKPVYMNFGIGTGELTDNHFCRTENGVIKTKQSQQVILDSSTYNKAWVIKSNIFITALLKQFIHSNYFRVIVTVRDPVAVIKSWRSLNFSLSRGKSMIAEKFDKASIVKIDTDDVMVKQVLLLDWMFKKYYENINHISILKYEEFIENPSIIQNTLNFCTVNEKVSLQSRNDNEIYNHTETNKIKACLTKYGKYYEYFYSNVGG